MAPASDAVIQRKCLIAARAWSWRNRKPWSFRSDSRTGNQPRELSGVRPHELRKLARRASHRFIAQLEHSLTHVRQSEHRDNLAMEPLHDVARRARRDQEALPSNHVEAR